MRFCGGNSEIDIDVVYVGMYMGTIALGGLEWHLHLIKWNITLEYSGICCGGTTQLRIYNKIFVSRVAKHDWHVLRNVTTIYWFLKNVYIMNSLIRPWRYLFIQSQTAKNYFKIYMDLSKNTPWIEKEDNEVSLTWVPQTKILNVMRTRWNDHTWRRPFHGGLGEVYLRPLRRTERDLLRPSPLRRGL